MHGAQCFNIITFNMGMYFISCSLIYVQLCVREKIPVSSSEATSIFPSVFRVGDDVNK